MFYAIMIPNPKSCHPLYITMYKTGGRYEYGHTPRTWKTLTGAQKALRDLNDTNPTAFYSACIAMIPEGRTV